MNNILIYSYLFCILVVHKNGSTTCLHHAPSLTNPNIISIEMASTKIVDSSTESKVCTKCNQSKSIESYRLRPDRNGARKSACSDCEAADTKRHRQTNETYRAQERIRMGGRKEYTRAYYDANSDRYRVSAKARRDATPKTCRVYFLTCQQTGELFTSKRIHTKYSKLGLSIRANLTLEANKDKSLEVGRLRYQQAFIPTMKQCKNCNAPYQTSYNSLHRNHCSPLCGKQYNKYIKSQNKTHKARCIKYNVAYQPINPYTIFYRDNWTCQMCGKPTPMELRGTKDHNAPELDHIIPLSRGGTHAICNVQCACRRCNGLKGDKIQTNT